MPAYRTVLVSDAAKRDLTQISEYTQTQWGLAQKQRYLGQISDRFKTLMENPGRGAMREDLSAGLRANSIGQHIIFFRDVNTQLVIVRILHKRMDAVRHIQTSGSE